jgi:hypothetical protein
MLPSGTRDTFFFYKFRALNFPISEALRPSFCFAIKKTIKVKNQWISLMPTNSPTNSPTHKTENLSPLEKLKLQRDKLNARIQATESRHKVTIRKQDTRRKILVGSYYLDKALKENTMPDLKKLMAGYLTRESDIALFHLDNVEVVNAEESPKTHAGKSKN